MKTKTIKEVKVHLVELVPLNSPEGKFAPITTISYNETDEPYYLWLDGTILSEDYFKGFLVGDSFFVGITATAYQLYDNKGESIGVVPRNQISNVLEVETIAKSTVNGFIYNSRAMTDEESLEFIHFMAIRKSRNRRIDHCL